MNLKSQKEKVNKEVEFLQQELSKLDQLKTRLITDVLKKQGQLDLIEEMLNEEKDANSRNTPSS